MRHERMAQMRIRTTIVVLVFASAAWAQTPAASWLDRPLSNWNVPASAVPAPPAADEPAAALIARCRLTPESGVHERALTAAGWIPFLPNGDRLVRDDVEVVGGMTGADGMCRPIDYNLFVFVSGRFAGTISPLPMDSRSDGASSIVRIALPEMRAEFMRYASNDPLCCPTSRMTVRYRIERTARGPLVVPVGVTTTRSLIPS